MLWMNEDFRCEKLNKVFDSLKSFKITFSENKVIIVADKEVNVTEFSKAVITKVTKTNYHKTTWVNGIIESEIKTESSNNKNSVTIELWVDSMNAEYYYAYFIRKMLLEGNTIEYSHGNKKYLNGLPHKELYKYFVNKEIYESFHTEIYHEAQKSGWDITLIYNKGIDRKIFFMVNYILSDGDYGLKIPENTIAVMNYRGDGSIPKIIIRKGLADFINYIS